MKMTKKILAALLVACSLFALVACGGDGIDYTKGTIENNVYTNEWANIKFELDSTTWKAGAASDYQSFENATTDCGLIAGVATEGRQLAIVFENNPGNSLDANGYLDNVKNGMTSSVSGYTFSEQYKKTIAGKEYTGFDAKLTQSGVTVYQTFFATQHDGKFISLVVTSLVGADEINSVLDKVTTVK